MKKNILGVLFLLAVVELLARAFWGQWYQVRDWGFYPYGAGDQLPSRTYIDFTKPMLPYQVKTNAQGLRSSLEYPMPKPPRVFRVVALGDSITFGLHVNNQETWPARVEEYFREDHINVEVMNTGVTGFTLPDEYHVLTEKAIRYQPDLAIVAFFANDIIDMHPVSRSLYQRKDLAKSPMRGKVHYALNDFLSQSAAVSLLMQGRSLMVIHRKLKSSLDLPRLLGQCDETVLKPEERAACLADYLSYVEKIAVFARENHIRLAFVFFPFYTEIAKEGEVFDYNKIRVKAALDKAGVPYLDLLPDFQAAGDAEQLYFVPYDWHMSRYGYQVAGRSIQRFLARTYSQDLKQCTLSEEKETTGKHP